MPSTPKCINLNLPSTSTSMNITTMIKKTCEEPAKCEKPKFNVNEEKLDFSQKKFIPVSINEENLSPLVNISETLDEDKIFQVIPTPFFPDAEN